MKKKLTFLITLVCVTALSVGIYVFASSEKGENQKIIPPKVSQETEMNEINDYTIGSEQPDILFADNSKVVFNNRGIFKYDFADKSMKKIVDTSLLIENCKDKTENSDVRASQSVSKDGTKIVIEISDFGNSNNDNLPKYYIYTFEDDKITEVSKDDFANEALEKFECKYLSADDEIFSKSTGMIAQIDGDNEYYYLQTNDFDLKKSNIIHVKNDVETIYPLAD